MRMKMILIASVLFSLFLLSKVKASDCTDYITDCGSYSDVHDKVYCLINNISTTGQCLYFDSSSNITIDCNYNGTMRHSITGSNTDFGVVFASSAGSKIQNCDIFNFSIGVELGSGVDDITLYNNYIDTSFIADGEPFESITCPSIDIQNNTLLGYITYATCDFISGRANISNNIVSGEIILVGCYDSGIENNRISRFDKTGNGVHGVSGDIVVYLSNNTFVNNNTITDAEGILIQGSNYTTLRNNTVTNASGFYFYVDNWLSPTSPLNWDIDIDDSNLFGGMTVYYAKGLSDVVLDGLQNKSVYCVDCSNVTIKNINGDAKTVGLLGSTGTIQNVNVSNIVLADGVYTVKDSIINDIGNAGLDMNNITNSNISNITMNGFQSYVQGVWLVRSSNNNISDISINGDPEYIRAPSYGVYLVFSPNNLMTNFDVSNTGIGARLGTNSNNNILSDFRIKNSNNPDVGYGLWLWNVNNTTFKDSIIENSSRNTMYLRGNYINHIYNNLFNNTVGFNSYGTVSSNEFNTTQQTGERIYGFGDEIGGNYYTNPSGTGYSDTCTDSDQNGFCDDTYTVVDSVYDYLPLSNQHSVEYTVIQENSTVYFPNTNYTFTDPSNYGYTIALNGSNIAIICNDTVFEFSGNQGRNSLDNYVNGIHGWHSGDWNWDTEYQNITIKGCTFKNYTVGVFTQNIMGLILDGNKFYNNYYSGAQVSVAKCQLDNDTWIDKTIWDANWSIPCVRGFGYAEIIDNYFAGKPEWDRLYGDGQRWNRGFGLLIEGQRGGIIKDNILAGNFSANHIRPVCLSNFTLENNTFYGAAYLVVWGLCERGSIWYSDNVTWRNNRWMHTSANVYTGEAAPLTFASAENTRNWLFENNYIQNTQVGIWDRSSSNQVKNNVFRNNILHNTIFPMESDYANNGRWINNRAYNDEGFCWTGRTGVVICLNDTIYTPSGIVVYFSDNGYYENNDIEDFNGYYDVYIESSYNNTGCGNVYNTSNVNLVGVSPSDNDISTDACPTPPRPRTFESSLIGLVFIGSAIFMIVRIMTWDFGDYKNFVKAILGLVIIISLITIGAVMLVF